MRTCRLHLHAQTNAIWSNLNIQLNVCTYRHAHTDTRAHTEHIHGKRHSAGCRVESHVCQLWQRLTWMLTHAQHQLSIWPWPAAGAENRWPIEAPTSRQFPHFPAHTSMGTCAALRFAVLRYWNSSKQQKCLSAFKHSLTHIHTHSYSHTLASDVEVAFAAAAAAAALQNSNYDNLKCISVSSRKCCILFSAYRQTTCSLNIFCLLLL